MIEYVVTVYSNLKGVLMKEKRFLTFSLSMILSILILTFSISSCSKNQESSTSQVNKSNSKIESQLANDSKSTEESIKSNEKTNDASEYPWLGPMSLGPGKDLPKLWCVEFVHFFEKDSFHCYRLSITSMGEWGDAVTTKGTITSDELDSVKDALSAIDWEKVPPLKDEDYIAYTAQEKSWPIELMTDNPNYEIKIWLGQTNCSPVYDGKIIVADLIAPCAPEVKKLIEILKPLQERYSPEVH